ncbi:NAD(P)H-binding protein [Halobacillus litoralis]|uniref:NAD(P)H-binding protein n=1 Tax=Halobacillus litoralis TaxID=45668 RepID=UPI001CD70C01|nr:NAD(P)H-binding protein [Halobacillus litoralis]MCA0971323.1 NAD(P)H-binding protein [Halobacillus litoralis]
MTKRPVVALTGASGYIGSHLLKKLESHADVIALSRNGHKHESRDHIQWRPCDLFSMADAERALEGADIAVYLVHSMIPSAKLTQGSFEDMDVILADNFAQAAKKQGVKRIIYLSGIMPEGRANLSRHLRSRLEVEQILGAYGVPVTTLRSGLIVGPQGSSFPVMAKLIQRIPLLCLPKWMKRKTQPVALSDVLKALDQTIHKEEDAGETFDVGGPEALTYKEMAEQLSDVMGRRLKIHSVRFVPMPFVKAIVRLMTGAPRQLVYPLVESLPHSMIVRKSAPSYRGTIPFKQAAEKAINEGGVYRTERQLKRPKPNDVRSVQRMPIPQGWQTEDVAQEYVMWLERVLNPWIRTKVDDQWCCQIGFVFMKKPLLELTYSKERSTPDRALYYITGGWLTDQRQNVRGRFEFRKIPGQSQAIAAIHEYVPALPWTIYRFTQAHVHLLVMWLFHHFLRGRDRSASTLKAM